MKRILLAAVILLAGCDSITGGDDYADIEVTQTVHSGPSSATITVNSIGDGELSGSWSAQYCTGGTFSFCYSDGGQITGSMDEGSNPNLSAVLHNEGCANDGSIAGMYSAAADRITGTLAVIVETSSGCSSFGGAL